MILINFSHPFTEEQLELLHELTGQNVQQTLDVQTHLDPAQPFAPQAQALVDSVGLSPNDWQTMPLLVNLPSLNVIAALVLAQLHGRMGYFPAVVRLRAVAGSSPPQFEVAEILNLQEMREGARQRR